MSPARPGGNGATVEGDGAAVREINDRTHGQRWLASIGQNGVNDVIAASMSLVWAAVGGILGE